MSDSLFLFSCDLKTDLRNCILLTPWSRVILEKPNGSQVVEKFPPIFWNPEARYRIYKCPLLVLITRHINTVHASLSHFLKIDLNIILPSTPGFSKWYFSFSYHHQTLYTPFHSSINATCPTHLNLDLFTRTILGRSTDSLGFSLCSFFRSPFTSFLLDPNILRSTIFSNTLSLRSSLPIFTPTQNNRQNHSFVYLILYIFG